MVSLKVRDFMGRKCDSLALSFTLPLPLTQPQMPLVPPLHVLPLLKLVLISSLVPSNVLVFLSPPHRCFLRCAFG